MKRPWVKGKPRGVRKGRTRSAPRSGTKRALVLNELRHGERDAASLARASGASINAIVHMLNTLIEKRLITRREVSPRRYRYNLTKAIRGGERQA